MIPKKQSILKNSPTIFTYPSETYRIDIEHERILGKYNGLDAVAQTAYLALTTEADKYPIYPNGFGIKTDDLYGKPAAYVQIKLEGRIEAALSIDDRIVGISDYEFKAEGGDYKVSFKLHTIYGDTDMEDIPVIGGENV